MRHELKARLGALVVGLSLLAPPRAFAGPPEQGAPTEGETEDETTKQARALYKEGVKAYRLGNFELAVEKFKAAYDLTPLPSMLYNVGLAYMNLYDTSLNVADLRTARAVLKNYLLALQDDPELGLESEVRSLLQEVEDKIAAHEEREAQKAQQASETDPQPEGPVAPKGPDPGRTQRIAGAASIGAGAAIGATGTILAVVYGLRGQEFGEELDDIYKRMNDAGCMSNSTDPTCEGLERERKQTVDNGHKANLLAAVLGSSLGAVGVAGIIAGSIIFVRGDRKTKEWKKGRIGIFVDPRGYAAIHGRF